MDLKIGIGELMLIGIFIILLLAVVSDNITL